MRLRGLKLVLLCERLLQKKRSLAGLRLGAHTEASTGSGPEQARRKSERRTETSPPHACAGSAPEAAVIQLPPSPCHSAKPASSPAKGQNHKETFNKTFVYDSSFLYPACRNIIVDVASTILYVLQPPLCPLKVIKCPLNSA